MLACLRGSRLEPSTELVRLKGCYGADDKVVLASRGREAYAGGGFHRGAATTLAARHTLCAFKAGPIFLHVCPALHPINPQVIMPAL